MRLYFLWLGIIIGSALIGSLLSYLLVRLLKRNIGPGFSGLVNILVGIGIGLVLHAWWLPGFPPGALWFFLFSAPPLLIAFFIGVAAPDGENPFS